MSGYEELEHLRVAVEDGIAVVSFHPRAEGALERSFFAELRDVFGILSIDAEVRAGVLTGGNDVFFAGVGLVRTARLLEQGVETMAGQLMVLKQIVDQLVSFRKPLVAAVNGPALNIGGQIALLCDAAVASETAVFGDDHVAKGVAAGDGGTMLFPLLLGLARAREVLLRDQRIGAREALELHLVGEVVAPGEVVPAAVALARELADKPRLPYAGTKLALANWWKLSSLISWDIALGAEFAGLVEPDYAGRLQAKAAEAREA
jgi:enoyl-CoA hydratase/carnithine racemase